MRATKKSLSIADLVEQAERAGRHIWEIVLEQETAARHTSEQDVLKEMNKRWLVMKQALEDGVQLGHRSYSGLVGEEGYLMDRYLSRGRSLSGDGTIKAASRAMGVAIINACQGKIVAVPTAGSCGILPAVLLTVAEAVGANDQAVVCALFTAAGMGMVATERATTAGAEGGCQAECGTASCMAAAAAVEMAGGSPRQAMHAGAMALKNWLGLVCDPVAGLVEVPCMKRNAAGAAISLLAADMAIAGVESRIPCDEVIDAMREIGNAMPASLKETSQGGLANTPTAREIEQKLCSDHLEG